MAEYYRPTIPYLPPEPLQNDDRYTLIAAGRRSPTGQDFDGDINYLIASLNSLFGIVQGIAAGIIPGADDPDNIYHFPITDGNNNITWSKVTANYINDNSIPPIKLMPIGTAQLGNAIVTRIKIAPDSIDNNLVEEGSLLFSVIHRENSVDFQEFFNAQDAGTLSGTKLLNNSLPADATPDNSFPGIKILDNSIPPQKLQNSSLTRQQLAPVVQLLIGQIVAWGGTAAEAPAGYVFAHGQTNLDRTQYALLFAVFGVAYGNSSDTTFGVPDYRGRCIYGIGADGSTGGRIVVSPQVPVLTIGATGVGGEQNHTLTLPETPAHAHSMGIQQTAICGAAGSFVRMYPGGETNTSSVGGGQAHNNMPPLGFAQILIYAGV